MDPKTSPDREEGDSSLVRHQEELTTSARQQDDAVVTIRTTVETTRVDQSIPRGIEFGEVERVPPDEDDSGEVETLEDGSISVPVLEEVITVTRRMIVRERIIVRKRMETDHVLIQDELRREHVEIEGPPGSFTVDRKQSASAGGKTSPLPGSSVSQRKRQ